MSTLKTEIVNGILTITINRPDKLNALNRQVISDIKEAVESGLNNKEVHGMILTGEGPKAFAAGADIAEFANYSEAKGEELSATGHHVFDKIEHASKPIIAAVNGFALGGGCELAMACHLRVASENARFGQPEVNLGVIPGYGGTQRLTRLIGRTKALEFLITGDMIKADEALRLGLVNHVVTQDELMNKCREILDKAGSKSPLAIGRIIALVNTCEEGGNTGFQDEIREFGRSFGTADFKEGTTAFLEKRTPAFTGK
ncbi:MAG: enoyl-CoA hydratase-related protein [Bacteroidia bacterium]